MKKKNYIASFVVGHNHTIYLDNGLYVLNGTRTRQMQYCNVVRYCKNVTSMTVMRALLDISMIDLINIFDIIDFGYD